METKLLERFFLEQGYISGDIKRYPELTEEQYCALMIEKYNSGEKIVGRLELDIWLNRFDKANIRFGQILKGMVKLDTDMVEVANSDKHCISSHIISTVRKNVVLERKDDIYENVEGKHLIMNGKFENGLSLIKNSIKNGKFSIGVCGNDNEFTQRQINYYKQIKESLLNGGIEDIKELDETFDHSQRIYMLNFNCEKPQKRIEYRKNQFHSER